MCYHVWIVDPEDGTRSQKSLAIEWPLWVLALLVLALFYKPLFFNEVFFYRDLSAHFIPCKRLLVELVSRGELPLWNPYLQGGSPFMANPNNMVLYPSGLLYFIFNPGYALTLDILFHMFLGIAGAYFLARALGFSRLPGFAAAVIYGFCGPALSLGCFLSWVVAFSLQPWILLFWHLYMTQASKKYFVCTVIAFVLQLLSGVPEFFLLSAGFFAAWTFLFPYTISPGQRLYRLCLVMAFVAVLGAIQIVPAVDLARVSSRSAHLDYSFFTLFSISPKRLPELFLSGFIGRFDLMGEGRYWGQALGSGVAPFVMSLYFGPTALYLLVMALFVDRGPLSRGVRSFCFAAVGVALLFAMGKYLPGFSWIYRSVPLVTFFRNPSKLVMASVLPAALLVASSLEFHWHPSLSAAAKKSARILWLLGALFVLILIARFAWAGQTSSLAQHYFQQTSTEAMVAGLTTGWLQAAIMVLLTALLCRTQERRSRIGLVVLLAMDLVWSGRHINFFAPEDIYAEPKIVPVIKQHLTQGKLYRTEYASRGFTASFPTPDRFWETHAYDAVLDGYYAANHDIPVIFHSDIDSSAPLRMLYYQTVLNSISWEKKAPLLAAAGVSLILTGEPIPESGLALIDQPASGAGMPLYLYGVPRALPPASFVSSWISRDIDKEAIAAMISPGYDPRRFVVLSGSRSDLQFHPCDGGLVRPVSERVNSSVYDVQAPCDGYVVFPRPFHSGWRCTVDGRPVSPVRANLIFSAVHVSAGKHTVTSTYLPASVVAGLWMTLFGVLALILFPSRFL